MARSQAKIIKSTNTYRHKVNFNVEDYVQLNTKYQNTARLSLKLDNNNTSPFKIITKKGYSFQLRLPNSMKINLVISLDKLRKSARDPLLGQVNKPENLVEITGNIKYKVQEILVV